MSKTFDFSVNGKAVSVTLDNEETPLLDVLRNELGLMGTRFGCGLEQCGCCMVLSTARRKNPAQNRSGASPVSESSRSRAWVRRSKPHPLQQAFIDEQAGQCGYCLSGILISAKALLDKNPNADARANRARRSMKIFAAADRTTASSAPSKRRPRPCATEARTMNAPRCPARSHDNPQLDRWVAFPAPGKVTVLDRPGRTRPGRAHRHGADRRRRTRCCDRAHHDALRGHRERRPTKATRPAANRSNSAASPCGKPAPTCGRCSSNRPRQSPRLQGGRTYPFATAASIAATHQPDRIIGRSPARSISPPKRPEAAFASASPTLHNIGASSAAPRSSGQDFRRCGLHPRHAARRHGACPRRAPAEPRRDDRRDRRSGDPPRRQRARSTFVRNGNFLAIVGDDETAVEAAGRGRGQSCHLAECRSADPDPAGSQLAVAAAGDRPCLRRAGAGRRRKAASASRRPTRAAISRMPRSRPPAGWRSFSDGQLTVWTHCQGVYPLRAALARTLKLDPAAIIVHHVQGSGLLRPQRRRRCRGRRRHHRDADAGTAGPRALAARGRIHLRAEQPGDGGEGARRCSTTTASPSTGRTEIWSGRRTIGGPAAAAICSAPLPCPTRRPSRRRTTCRKPTAAAPPAMASRSTIFAAKRIMHHLVTETPVRTSALRGLGAMPNVFALECCIDELAERAGQDPVALPAVDHRRSARARRDRESGRDGELEPESSPAARAAAAALPSPATKTAPPTPRSSSSSKSRKKSACATSGARPMPGLWSIPTARSTSSKAASFSRQAGCSRSKCASTTASPHSTGKPTRC